MNVTLPAGRTFRARSNAIRYVPALQALRPARARIRPSSSVVPPPTGSSMSPAESIEVQRRRRAPAAHARCPGRESRSVGPSPISASLRPPSAGNLAAVGDLAIRVGDLNFTARWEADAPLTQEALRAMLPLRSQLIHCKWSGEGCWIPFGDREAGGRLRESHVSPGAGRDHRLHRRHLRGRDPDRLRRGRLLVQARPAGGQPLRDDHRGRRAAEGDGPARPLERRPGNSDQRDVRRLPMGRFLLAVVVAVWALALFGALSLWIALVATVVAAIVGAVFLDLVTKGSGLAIRESRIEAKCRRRWQTRRGRCRLPISTIRQAPALHPVSNATTRRTSRHCSATGVPVVARHDRRSPRKR